MGEIVICELLKAPIDEAAISRSVRRKHLGGVVVFSGDVRADTDGEKTVALEYEAYAEMAVAQMREIGEEAAARWDATISLAHRIGMLQPGESAVVIACACVHRAAAFDCCRFVIDKLKEDVPIWKKEKDEA